MKLEEKITLLRKKQGWSQEELGFRLDVSRQAVSKWEMGDSTPDLDKILKMSELFGCSTDYLLKDDVLETTFPECEELKTSGKEVSDEEGETYLSLVKNNSWKIAFGVACCILSPVWLFLLQGISDLTSNAFSSGVAGGLGVGLLLLTCAIGVLLLVYGGMSLSKYEYLEKTEIKISENLKKLVQTQKDMNAKNFAVAIGVGVGLCVISSVPLIVVGAIGLSGAVSIFALVALFVLVAIGVFLFVKFGMIHSSYQKLLQENEYSVEKKREEKRMSAFSGAFWCLATALYLGWSFFSGDWDRTWIVWPIAGVLFAGLYQLILTIQKKK